MKKILLMCLMAALGYHVFPQMHVDIAEIKSSSRHINKTVYISGKVIEVNKISTAECKYMLQDEEGDRILVSSAHGCPVLNKSYTVRGIVATDKISFMAYLKEEERIPITPPAEDLEIINIVDYDEEDEEVIDVVQDDFEEFDAEEDEEEEMVFIIVEDMPKFQGGDQNEFRRYVQENLQYPDSAVAKGISGKVFVQFVVNSRGKVVNTKIVRGVDPYLDNEALRVINSSPLWEPGTQRGRPVSVQFTFPVVFVLQ
jgi:TonB family protein